MKRGPSRNRDRNVSALTNRHRDPQYQDKHGFSQDSISQDKHSRTINGNNNQQSPTNRRRRDQQQNDVTTFCNIPNS
jgi:hypothetical protein